VHTEIKYTEHASPFYSCFGTLHQAVYNSQPVQYHQLQQGDENMKL